MHWSASAHAATELSHPLAASFAFVKFIGITIGPFQCIEVLSGNISKGCAPRGGLSIVVIMVCSCDMAFLAFWYNVMSSGGSFFLPPSPSTIEVPMPHAYCDDVENIEAHHDEALP